MTLFQAIKVEQDKKFNKTPEKILIDKTEEQAKSDDDDDFKTNNNKLQAEDGIMKIAYYLQKN